MSKNTGSGGLTPDEELVRSARSGDAESLAALAARYVFIPRRLAEVSSGLGMDMDDLRQEALIALMRALHSYDPAKGAGFATYAAVCIRRHLFAAVRSCFRQKNLPMVGYLPLEEGTALSGADPEALMIEAEEFAAAREKIFSALSPFEGEALRLYLSGLSYAQTAEKIGKSERSVGNALARARRKLRSEA